MVNNLVNSNLRLIGFEIQLYWRTKKRRVDRQSCIFQTKEKDCENYDNSTCVKSSGGR